MGQDFFYMWDDNDPMKSGQLYKTLFENAGDGIFIMSAEKFLECNPMTLKIYGCSTKEDIIGRTPMEFSPEFQPDGQASLTKAMIYINEAICGNPQKFYWRHIRKDGTPFDAEVGLNSLQIGNETFLQAIVRDITELREANRRIQKSETLFRTAFDVAATGKAMLNLDDGFIRVNESFSRIYGYSSNDIQSLRWTELTHPEDKALEKQKLKYLLSGEIPYINLLSRKRTKAGHYLHVNLNAIVVWDNDEKPVYLLIDTIDLTQIVQSQRMIAESERRYRVLFEGAPVSIGIIDMDQHIVAFNPEAIKMFGYADYELAQLKVDKLISSADDLDIIIKELDQEKHLSNRVLLVRSKDGREFFVNASFTKFQREGESNVMVVALDIDDAQKKEQKLKASEQRFRKMATNIQDGMLIVEDNVAIFCNHRMSEITGYNLEEFSELDELKLATPEERNRIEGIRDHALKTGLLPRELEYWMLSKNGRRKYIRNRYSYLDQTIPPRSYFIFMSDITENKRAELIQSFVQNMTNAILQTESTEAFYKVIQVEINEILPAQNISIGLLDEQENILEFVYSEGDPIGKRVSISGTLSEMVIHNRKPLLLDQVEMNTLEKQGKANLRGKAAQSWLGVPLFYLDKIIGLIVIQDFEKKDAYGVDELKIMEILGNSIALSIIKKKNQDELDKLSRSVDHSPVNVVITNVNGEIEYVNKKFEEITGYTAQEVVGQNPRLLQSGLTPEETYEEMWSTLKDGKDWKGILVNKKKDGETYWEEAHISPFFDRDGRVTHFVAVKEDVTSKREAQQELVKAKEKAEESDKLKSTFMATMSHELRTPLNAVLGFSELLREVDNIEDVKEFSKTIHNSGLNLLEIIEDIFEITSLETGQTLVEKRDFRLSDLYSDLYEFTLRRLDAELKELDVELNFPDQLNSHNVLCDYQKVKKIFEYLIGNAVKFTMQGKIQIGCFIDENNRIVHYVKDTGVGISRDKQEIIFESFRQADDTHTRKFGGTGLGLAITKKFIELMGGEIWLESKLDFGTSFYFCIHDIGFSNEQEKKVVKNADSVDLSGFTILVTEDEESNYLYLETVLEKLKARILWAENGRQAIEMCSKEKVDIILMDMKMPVMNGFDATREIKAKHPNLPIIAQTALAMPGDEQRVKDAGCDSYITKPIRKSALYSLLVEFLNK